MTAIRSNLQNAFETQLTAEMGPSDLSALVQSIGSLSDPAYLVIEPDHATRREYVLFDATFTASSFATTGIGNRYLAGSAQGSNITHPVGSIVRAVPLAQHITDLHDRIDQGFDHGNLAGLADDDHAQYPLVDGSRGFSGPVVVGEPSLSTEAATKSYVDAQVAGGIPTGMIMPFAGPTAPGGYLLCNGAAVSRTLYPDLFTLIGTTYGAGDGSTTFNVPDLRQRFPIGKADSGTASVLGSTGGAIDHTHSTPSHSHSVPSHTHSIPSHTHTMPSHSHTVDPPATTSSAAGSHSHGGLTGGETAGDGDGPSAGIAGSGHYHTLSSDGSHTHSTNIGSFSSGSTDPGDTNSGGSGTSGSGGSGTTGTDGAGTSGSANPPYIALNFVIKT